jgi:putative phage-type endonuclease
MEAHLIQRSPEWFSWRQKHIGSSDSGVVLGVSPWKTPYELFVEKTSPFVEVSHMNVYMKRGADLEPQALREFEQETGYLMAPDVLEHPIHKWMAASLDGLEIDKRAALEIKCGGHKSHEMALEGVIPDYYIAQLQHQIEVTGLDKIYYYSYRPEHEIKSKIIEVYRDDEYISNLVQKESAFYLDHMLTGIPPENPKKLKIIETEQWKRLTDEYKKMEYQCKEAEKRKEEIKDMLLQISDAEPATGNGLSLQKVERKGNIPYASLPMLKGVNLEEYRKPGTSYWQVKEANDG